MIRYHAFLRLTTAALLGLAAGGQQLLVGAQPSGRVVLETARVVRVIDGDTYVLLAGATTFRLRLRGVDAPETDQPFGVLAADSVRRLLPAGQLVLVRRAGLDLYGRTLGDVLLLAAPARPMALDSVLVVRGWAWAYDPTHTVAGRAQQQMLAQRAGRGLWRCGTLGPVPPKLWRSFAAAVKRRYAGGCAW
ncbi:hypothetical protein HHL22_12025 [Hymenobacter sp. RP-2-7]|uniref:TNase-like domain-containing protein n=1 Tax=Hymenobacter polaris TaxID=2682546 RepID=A0A7Y0AEN2_9BACT|nr:thermonuclease family protein [Hymenobacter polaris]NML65934.1 hypothetical protein [Hymenobacter polaris]